MEDLQSKAMEVQGKLEFYLVALTFTVFAFAIQSSRFGQSIYGDGFEVLAWVLLILSGIKGILRLRFVPVVLRSYAAKALNQVIDEEHLKRIEEKIASEAYIWLFVAGLIFLALARASSPLLQALEYIRATI